MLQGMLTSQTHHLTLQTSDTCIFIKNYLLIIIIQVFNKFQYNSICNDLQFNPISTKSS